MSGCTFVFVCAIGLLGIFLTIVKLFIRSCSFLSRPLPDKSRCTFGECGPSIKMAKSQSHTSC